VTAEPTVVMGKIATVLAVWHEGGHAAAAG
jgi:hypothetical protein